MEEQVFDLARIKEITNPIEGLESSINNLEIGHEDLSQKYKRLQNYGIESDYTDKLNEIISFFNLLRDNIVKNSRENLNKFLIFQDLLVKKYRDLFKDNLKRLKINKDSTKQIGLYLIESKKISKIISESSDIPAISIIQWVELLDSLNQNSLFLSVIKNVRGFYNELIEERYETEITKIPDDTDPKLIDEYKKAFSQNPLSFNQFLIDFESNLTKKEQESRRELIKKAKEQEKLQKLKEKQVEQEKSFQDYFRYSEKEFQRIRRKKKRKKLSEIDEKPKVRKELSEEVSEKIEKFKSQMKQKFEEEYLIKRDDEKDPLDLIRERKKKKQEEFKEFISRFESKE